MTRSTFLSLGALAPLGVRRPAARSAGTQSAVSRTAAANVLAAPAAYRPAAVSSLTRSGTTLKLGGTAVRMSGMNAYWLGLDDNAGTPTGSVPSPAKITAALAGMRGMGANLVRAHTIGISAGTPRSYLTGYVGTTPQYSKVNMAAADWAVYQAGLYGIHLMCPLTDEWNYYHGGLWWFVHQAYLQNPSDLTDVDGSVKDDPNNRQFFGTSPAQLRIRALFAEYVTHWLEHVNQYTGVAYKDDPTIAIVETGNEIYPATREWTAAIAAVIKAIAPRKLVADGAAASGMAVSAMPGLSVPAVDIVGSHYYPSTGAPQWAPSAMMTASALLGSDVATATAAGKAFVIGEYPWTRADIASWWSDVEATASVAADCAWSFIPNFNSGAPEPHGGAFGSDDYPVHWPYSGAPERSFAPALARHISLLSGVSDFTQSSRAAMTHTS